MPVAAAMTSSAPIPAPTASTVAEAEAAAAVAVTTSAFSADAPIEDAVLQAIATPEQEALGLPELATPVRLRWIDVSFSVQVKEKKGCKKAAKNILCSMNGVVQPGEMLAIMGPSGSGKTSLLNVLSGRLRAIGPCGRGASLSGLVAFNNTVYSAGKAPTDVAVCSQDDYLYSNLTVQETLILTCRLRLGQNDAELVERLILQLGLSKCASTRIGNEKLKGISGGERKRTAVAVELISNPSVLFLDEPTSGLDSYQAQNVMGILARLARDGRTVVSVIHQPRSSIYNMCDRLLLLAEGREAYFGAASAAVEYFGMSPLEMHCPALFNPADFFLDLLSINSAFGDSAVEASVSRISKITDSWGLQERGTQRFGFHSKDLGVEHLESDALVTTATDFDYSQVKVLGNGKCQELGFGCRLYKSCWCVQFGLLYQRACFQAWREVIALIIPPIAGLGFSIVLALLYFNLDYSQNAIQDRSGALFFICLNQCFGSMVRQRKQRPLTISLLIAPSLFLVFMLLTVSLYHFLNSFPNDQFAILNSFPDERAIVNRQRQSKMYHASAYFVSKLLAELPLRCFSPIFFSVIVYWTVGFNPDPIRFLIFIVIVLVLSFTAGSLGLVIASVAPSGQAAASMGPPILVVAILFGGFYGTSRLCTSTRCLHCATLTPLLPSSSSSQPTPVTYRSSLTGCKTFLLFGGASRAS